MSVPDGKTAGEHATDLLGPAPASHPQAVNGRRAEGDASASHRTPDGRTRTAPTRLGDCAAARSRP
ncbi:hypothetical protein GCM10010286_15840 [Streptomyces toxytricini]|nr:hypothetical protein GCM10010286_15840 [Streptomyces toxytricini]